MTAARSDISCRSHRSTLGAFGRVDAIEADTRAVDFDCVAVDNERHANKRLSRRILSDKNHGQHDCSGAHYSVAWQCYSFAWWIKGLSERC
ncbi:hypothetical protein [Mesorhizobium opportunistum]|uniref:hypothetical protein n=1 Tax=Mesorhizobium opportunistum TaxID=593909 RepID=UPI001427D6BA|nr:hypothetical protein [Mesorhizobium opportunistum]